MQNINIIETSISKLKRYIIDQSYKGYDPYDALKSPIFKLPYLRSNKFIKLGTQQVVKRLPFNIRPFIGIRKDINPVTLGLVLYAYTELMTGVQEIKREYLKTCESIIDNLELLSSKGYSGICWGYDFDWQARYAHIPAFFPTVVATGIITNALYKHYCMTHHQRSFDLCRSAALFVLKDLHRSYNGKNFCFSYSPNDYQIVYNATLKGARLLTQVYSVTREQLLIDTAEQTVQFVVAKQTESGSWSYSYGDTRTWCDNFHTGYVLDSLDEFEKLSGITQYHNAIQRGIEFYVGNFFVDNEIPKYYSNRVYPIDSTAVSQSIITLLRFGYVDLASKVALYAIRTMQDRAGYFYYQKHKNWVNKISYMRWSNAWMFAALSSLKSKIS